jgi:hypothetical protein
MPRPDRVAGKQKLAAKAAEEAPRRQSLPTSGPPYLKRLLLSMNRLSPWSPFLPLGLFLRPIQLGESVAARRAFAKRRLPLAPYPADPSFAVSRSFPMVPSKSIQAAGKDLRPYVERPRTCS